MLDGGSSSNERGQPAPPKGLYMHGGVGTGKTMLMDLLVGSAPPDFKVGNLMIYSGVGCSWHLQGAQGMHFKPKRLYLPQAVIHRQPCCYDEMQIQSNCCSFRLTMEEIAKSEQYLSRYFIFCPTLEPYIGMS